MSNGTQLPLFSFDSTVVPDIDFCVKDASLVESDVISKYENMFFMITRVAKTLGRGDPVRLFLLSIIYQLVVQRSIVDSTGKENLLKYSHGANLDNLGAKWGLRGGRLKATSAATMLRFTLSSLLTSESTIPLGTLAQSGDARVFKTTAEGTIPPGGTSIDLPAMAVEPGALANGLVAGQVNQLVSWASPFLVNVTNTTTTSGGADEENDDHLRARIWMAPESFSVAGPYGAYEYWAASANPDIIDVSVWSQPVDAGKVFIHPLMEGGRLPTQAELDQVYDVCNAENIRPLTDQVLVSAPIVISYDCIVKYWIKSSDKIFASDIQLKCDAAYAEFLTWQKTKIGRDINPSKLDQMLVEAGAKRTDISEATCPFEFLVLDEKSVAQESGTSQLLYQGLEDE
jgi:phage-related baseplate assembly protein